MLFQPGKIAAASRLCWERGVALVVVGFPATPLMTARARVCISASHTREDLERALQVWQQTGLPAHGLLLPRRCAGKRPRGLACMKDTLFEYSCNCAGSGNLCYRSTSAVEQSDEADK